MQLSFMLCIVDRRRSEAYVSLCRSLGLPLTLSMLGRGTAMRAHLDLYGLEATQKAVVATVADGQNARRLFREAKRQLYLDIPGNGIMLALPIKSVGGGKTLAYLTDNRPLEAQAPPAGFEHELLVIILNEGYIDEVMEARRAAPCCTPRAQGRARRKNFSASRWPTKKRCCSSWQSPPKKPASCALSSAHTAPTPRPAQSPSPSPFRRSQAFVCWKTNKIFKASCLKRSTYAASSQAASFPHGQPSPARLLCLI